MRSSRPWPTGIYESRNYKSRASAVSYQGNNFGHAIAVSNRHAARVEARDTDASRLVIDAQKSLLACVSDGTLAVWDISTPTPMPTAFLLGCTPAQAIAADVPVAQAKPQHTNLMCSPSPHDNCYDVYDSMMQRCAGMPRKDERMRCQRAAADQLAECKEKDKDYIGGGGRF